MSQSPRVTHCKLFAPPVSRKQVIIWSQADQGEVKQEYFVLVLEGPVPSVQKELFVSR